MPVPDRTAGTAVPVIDLNGTWKFSLIPPGEFWSNAIDPSGFRDKETYAAFVHGKYLEWQSRYLD